MVGGKLILKGIMDPDDAGRAVDAGADAAFICKALLSGPAATGEAGVTRVLEIIARRLTGNTC